MATQVTIRSREQILGNLVRSLSINSDITSFSEGSDIGTLLEGISESLSQIEASSLKILESINVEALVGSALDKKAQSIRLPNGQGGYGRKPSTQASGPIVIGSSFAKVSSKLYAGKPAPFAGSTTLYLEDASSFTATGSVYLGRNTLNRFEGPIPYSGVVNSGSFWILMLDLPLTKNHLQSDIVTLSQGGDRVVKAGTTVQIPSNNDYPAVNFTTLQDLAIPDGESEGTVNVVCSQFGIAGNALAGSIKQFTSAPFPGATVRNPTTFRNGQSTENDEDLRQRIKNHPATLSRGTSQAIESAIKGAVDPSTGRSIQSIKILPPVEPGDFARVIIDDNTGLEPSFDNQASELLLKSSAGRETNFSTTQKPITSVMAEGSEIGPFVLQNTYSLTVDVDGVVETYYVTPSNYSNLNSASAYEIVRDMNAQSNLLGFRTLDDGKRVVAIDLSGESEIIKITAGDLQSVLGLPTAELRPIFLYKNTELLSFRGKTATLETRQRNEWNITASDLTNIRMSVGGVVQTFSITDADFSEFGSTISSATIAEWATVFSRKVAGVKFTASGQILVWSSYNTFSELGTLEVLETKADGTPAGWIGSDKIWLPATSGGVLYDAGASKDYNFNRFTGEIELLQKPSVGDTIEIATRNTRALVRSSVTDNGLYSLLPIASTVGNSKLILGFDGTFAIRNVTVAPGATLTPTQPNATGAKNVIRATINDVGIFENALVGDYFYILPDASALSTVLPTDAEGFYRIISKGYNSTEVDVDYLGLLGATATFSGLVANTEKDSDIVVVSKVDHGLKTGDLVTVSTALAIGGISAGNLSVTDAVVTKVNKDKFSYQALAAATSKDNGLLDTVGHNKILVTHAAHGFSDGANVTISTANPFGGISAINLSVANTPIELVDSNNYYYRASSASTSAVSSQTITQLTLLADTWVEFEVSSVQFTTWSTMLSTAYGLTEYMLSIFKSDGATPQLVDFGTVSSLTVDEIVSSINSQVSSGSAVKVTPQQLEIHSNDFSESGTCAVLASIGNATNLFAKATSSAIQPHIANASTAKLSQGAPVVSDVSIQTDPSLGYATRSYLVVDRNITNITTEDSNPVITSPAAYNSSYPVGFQHTWITGREEGLTARVYNNQTAAPYTGILIGEDNIRPLNTADDTQTSPDSLDLYSNIGIRIQDLPVNNNDAVVVEMDLNPTDKTVNVPMAKLAKIQDIDSITGSGKGQVISFRLLDPEDSDRPFFDSTSVYKDFDFRDFKILTKSVGLYREDVSDRALILRSVDYGAATQLRFSVRYASDPDQADFAITHTMDFLTDRSRLNLVATLPSDSLITGSTYDSSIYKVTSTASGNLFEWRISAAGINPTGEYATGNILNISGVSSLSGSYQILSSINGSNSNLAIAVTATSNVVTVTHPSHNLQTGDLISVVTSSNVGGITASNLSVENVEITVTGANSYTYQALANATVNDSGILDTVNAGVVIISTPGNGGLSPSNTYDASVSPIRTYPLINKTLEDLATAINGYLVDNPVASAIAIGTDFALNPIADPTYITYTASSAYSGSDMSGAFRWHSFDCKYSGSAGIFQYDSSVPSANNIKATVQTDDSIFPTTTEASGTSYSPVGEEIQIVPTNNKTLDSWFNFTAISSLSLLASVDRHSGDSKVQISSLEDGSDGAVNVTGVTANAVSSSVIGNASNVDNSIKLTSLSASVRSLMQGQYIKVSNTLSSEILRAYRNVPTGSSVTLANTTEVNTYFRPENSIKYVRVSANVGRLMFLRNGMYSSQSEPLDVDNTITLTDLGSGLVQITSAQGANPSASTGKLSARVGDMMYIQPDSGFAVDARCKAIPTSGIISGNPEYLGYPVVHVIDDSNIVVLAPNISTFNTVVLADGRELVFIPSIFNEKNIRTNHKAGAKFDEFYGDGQAFYLIKSLGNGFVSLFLQNTANESTDDMLLDNLSVSTDDFVVLSDGFDPSNQGTFRLVAHNGRNHVVFYNPEGGKDEIIDTNALSNGGEGSRKWRVGPIDADTRSLRIISGDSVRVGDKVRISSPVATTQWFNDVFFGSWTISDIGYTALDYTAYPTLPHSSADGDYDQNFIVPYIDFDITNAPISITDDVGADVDTFLIGGNNSSIGFTEGNPFSSIRMVAGHGVNAQNIENRDLFLRPKLNTQKMSQTFGTVITGLNKIGFSESTFLGIDGYKVYSGLVREAHRIIDGLPNNKVVYPGVKAAGAIIEVQTPLIRSVTMSLQVRPTDGVTLNSISELVKSAAASYINSLGVGNPVVISEVIRTVKSLPGVFSVTVLNTLPAAEDDRIVVGSQEKAFVLDVSTDIEVG